MPTLAERIAAIREKLESGTESVRFADRGVTYDLEALRKELQILLAQQAAQTNPQRSTRTLLSMEDV